MKYVMFITGDEVGDMTDPNVAQMFEAIGKWWDEQVQAGRIVGGAQLAPARTATTVSRANGKPVVTDGPYIEAKEAIGGYALVEVPDLDAAIAMAASWPPGSKIEIRPTIQM